MTDDPDDGRREWDADFAATLIGKTLLVGVTYLDPDDCVIEQVQFHGVIVEADPGIGVTINCQGENLGQKVTVPPDLGAIEPAGPGEYRLRSTGEVITDPDFTTSWTIRRPHS